jgi:hypothetical protein
MLPFETKNVQLEEMSEGGGEGGDEWKIPR